MGSDMDDKAAWDEVEFRVTFLADALAMRADEDMLKEARRRVSEAVRAYKKAHANRFSSEMSRHQKRPK